MNEFVVIPVYVKTSLSILNRPYSGGKPFVLATTTVSAVEEIPTESVVLPEITSVVRLSSFKY